MMRGLGAVILLSYCLRETGFAQAVCSECHSEIYTKQRASPHANALRPFEGSRFAAFLQEQPRFENGGYTYSYGGQTIRIAVANGDAKGTLEWVFGAGAQGMTAVGQKDGKYFEFRLSLYTLPDDLWLTPGHPRQVSSAPEALGSVLNADDDYRCFNCHATGVEQSPARAPNLSAMTPGLTCERCHGPGGAHINAVRQHRTAAEIRKTIFNAGRLSAKSSVEVCAECHRASMASGDPVSVRFQAIGLTASECFRKSGKLSCTTCHDPHTSVVRDAASYVTKCQECHPSQSTVASCKSARGQDCLTCHMRRTNPMPLLVFTDHRIRRYPGSPSGVPLR